LVIILILLVAVCYRKIRWRTWWKKSVVPSTCSRKSCFRCFLGDLCCTECWGEGRVSMTIRWSSFPSRRSHNTSSQSSCRMIWIPWNYLPQNKKSVWIFAIDVISCHVSCLILINKMHSWQTKKLMCCSGPKGINKNCLSVWNRLAETFD